MRGYQKVRERQIICGFQSMCDLSDEWTGDLDYEDTLDDDEAIDDAEEL